MLSVNGLHNFYYLPELHDMRCEAKSKIIRHGKSYYRERLGAAEIYRRKNSKETTEIIAKLKTELYDLLVNPDESRSELMEPDLRIQE